MVSHWTPRITAALARGNPQTPLANDPSAVVVLRADVAPESAVVDPTRSASAWAARPAEAAHLTRPASTEAETCQRKQRAPTGTAPT